jgi:tetratricopeptide (TPR) repeat protein
MACIFFLSGIHFLEWMVDPLGQSPVLDARENLAWAERIESGALPAEPFYRALLYPALLAILPSALWLGPLLGLVFHFVNAGLCALLARRVWGRSAAGWFAGVLYGLYPVALYFSVQLLDITASLTLFLVAVYFLLGLRERPRIWCAVLGGTAAGMAVLARPNFLPPVLLFPVLAFASVYLPARRWRLASAQAFGVLIPILMLFVLQGSLNQRLSGEFRILPWQGAYNLYAANSGDANGKFFKQRVSFDEVPAGMNPTRMESEYLYRQALGPEAELDVGAMSAHWRRQLLEEIQSAPSKWLALMGRKIVYLLNDWEQYNNLSYEYQKERFTILGWNPLGWGVILIGAIVSLLFVWRRMEKIAAVELALLALAYAAGLLLFFVSARFRLPIAPFLVIAAAGLVCVPWKQLSRLQWAGLSGLVLGAGALIYGNWFGARTTETYRQDQVLLASASTQLGRDLEALGYASQALEADPDLNGARRIRIASRYNLWLMGNEPGGGDPWAAIRADLKRLERADASSEFIRGVASWRGGEAAQARQIWIDAIHRYGQAAISSAHALEWVSSAGGDGLSPGAASVGEVLER